MKRLEVAQRACTFVRRIMIQVGCSAPEFRANALDGGEQVTITLSQFQDHWIVIYFYTKDDTEVCASENRRFREAWPEFDRLGARVIAASIDGVDAHRRWRDSGLGPVPYFWVGDESKELARSFGVLHEDTGLALRATIIIDPDSIVRYASVCDLAIGRSVSETLRVLQALQTGKMTPCEWKPGEPTL